MRDVTSRWFPDDVTGSAPIFVIPWQFTSGRPANAQRTCLHQALCLTALPCVRVCHQGLVVHRRAHVCSLFSVHFLQRLSLSNITVSKTKKSDKIELELGIRGCYHSKSKWKTSSTLPKPFESAQILSFAHERAMSVRPIRANQV